MTLQFAFLRAWLFWSTLKGSPKMRKPTVLEQVALPKWVEWVACATGLLGSALLALHNAYSGFGFLAFLVSNVGWIAFGIYSRTWSMVLMQLGFTATSVLGLYNYFG